MLVTSAASPFTPWPTVEIDVPEGWEPWPRHDALVAAGRTEWTGFRPNMCVTTMRVEGPVSLEQAAEIAWKQAEQNPDFEEIGREFVSTDDAKSFRFEFAFSMPGVGGLFQAGRVLVAPHEAFTDVIYAVGSCSGSQIDGNILDLRSLTASARLR